MQGQTLVLGIGNSILGDDGVGVHTIRHLRNTQTHFSHIEYVDGGCLSYNLLDYFYSTENLIVIDATQLNAAPGTIAVFRNDEIERFVMRQQNRTVHEINLLDVFAMASLVHRLPMQRVLIAVQPESTEVSTELSWSVRDSIPKVTSIVSSLVRGWHHETSDGLSH